MTFNSQEGGLFVQRKLLVILILSLVILSGCSSSDGDTKDYNLDISVEGEGEVENSGPVEENKKVTLTAQQFDDGDDWSFDRWEGDLEGDKNPITFVAQEKMQIKAVFKDKPNFKSTVTNQQIAPGGEIEFVIEAVDSDSDSLEYEIVDLDEDLKGHEFEEDPTNSGKWKFSHPGSSVVGDYEIIFEVSDGELTKEKRVVIGVNGPPIIESIEKENAIESAETKGYKYKALEIDEGEELLMKVLAVDPNLIDSLDYRLEGEISANLKDVTEEETNRVAAQNNEDLREFAWTPGYDHVKEGSQAYETLITVSDGLEKSNRKVIIIVKHRDRPPVLEGVSDKRILEGEGLNFVVIGSDPDGDEVTLSLQGLPADADFNAETGEFSWQSEKGDTGEYKLTFKAESNDKTTTKTAVITVGDVNRRPILERIENQEVDEGQELSFSLNASDEDGDELSYSVNNLPQGANFNQAVGEFNWRPSSNAQGNYEMEFRVSDGELEDSDTMVVTVGDINRPPQLEAVTDQELREGSTLSFTTTADDPDGDEVFFSAQGLPQGAELNENGEFIWTPDYEQAGSYEITLLASDGNLTSKKSFAVEVKNLSRAPILKEIGDKEVNEGEELKFQLDASSPDGSSLNYRALNLPPGAEFNTQTGEFSWQPDYDELRSNQTAEEYKLIFLVEAAGKIAREEITIELSATNRAPIIEEVGIVKGAEGEEVNFTLEASDPDGEIINYDAVSLPQGAKIDQLTGQFSWIPNYEQAGNYELIFIAKTEAKNTRQKVAVKVENREEAVDSPPVLAKIEDKEVNEASELSFLVTASDPDGDEITLSAQNLPSGAEFNPETGKFIWIPGYQMADEQNGRYRVSFVAAANGKSDSQEVTILVSEFTDVDDSPPVIAHLADQEVTRGEELRFKLTASDPNGEEITLSAKGLPSGAEFNTQTGEFIWTPGSEQIGNYELTLQATANDKTVEKVVTVTVTNDNDLPVIESISNVTAGEAVVKERNELSLVVGASDMNGDELSYSIIGADASKFSQDGNEFSWTPSYEAAGVYNVSLVVNDGQARVKEEIEVRVTNRDQLPVLEKIGNKSVQEDEELSFRVSASDPDGEETSLSVEGIPEGAEFNAQTGEFLWTPNFEQRGNYELVFSAQAGEETVSERITISVGDVNRPPELDTLSQTIEEDNEVRIDLLATANDVDGDQLSISDLTDGSNGAVENNGDGTITYSPAENWNGEESFTYTVSDGELETTGEVEITVTAVNDSPVAKDDSITIEEDNEIKIDLLANDSDIEGDDLSIVNLTEASNGQLEDNGDGTITYSPDENWNGEESFTYTVSDGELTVTAEVIVRVTPVDDPLVLEEIGNKKANEGQLLSFIVDFEEVDGDEVTLSVDNLPQGAEFNTQTGEFTWVPSYQQRGNYELVFSAQTGEESDSQEITISVGDVNTPPEVRTISTKTDEDHSVIIDILANVSDPEGDSLSIVNLTEGSKGEVEDNGDGTVTYSPAENWNGEESFTYTVSDGELTSRAEIRVRVNPIDDPPFFTEIGDKTVKDGQLLSFRVSASDPDGDNITLGVSNLPSGAEFDNSTGEFAWRPTPEELGEYELSFIAKTEDESIFKRVMINVTRPNQAPEVGIDSLTLDEDSAETIDLVGSASDANGDELSITNLTEVSNGQLVDNGDGTVTYSPDEDWNGKDSFHYTVSDGKLTDTTEVTVTVNPVNDSPVANEDSAATDEDNRVTIDLLSNDSDIEGDSLSISVVNDGSNGIAEDNGDGTVTYSPNADWNGEDSFNYTVSDGSGGTDIATVTVTVNPVDDPPVLAQIGDKEVDEGKELSFAVTDQDIGNQITLSVNNLPAGANFDAQTGGFTWTPASDAQGSYELTFTAEADGKSDSETITITVNDKLDGGVNPEESPAQPTGLTANYNSGAVTLNVDNPTGGADYMVYRSTTNDSATAEPITDVLVNLASWNDSSVESGNDYYYWVRSYNKQGLSSELSNQAQVSLQGSVTLSGLHRTGAGVLLEITSNISDFKDGAGNKLSGDYDLTVSSNLDGQVLTQSAVTFDAGAPQDVVKIPVDKLITPGTHTLTLEIQRDGEFISDTDEIEVVVGARAMGHQSEKEVTVHLNFHADVKIDSAEVLSNYSFDADGDGTAEIVGADIVSRDSNWKNYVTVTFTIQNSENDLEIDVSKIIIESVEDKYGNIINVESVITEVMG